VSVVACQWLIDLNFDAEHNISGDVLCMLDLDGLKAVGISTVGQRLHILKSVYLLKLAQSIPIDPDHYIPPCSLYIVLFCHLPLTLLTAEAQERHEPVSLDRLHEIVTEQSSANTLPFLTVLLLTMRTMNQDRRLQSLEDENKRLNEVLQSFFEEFNHLRSSLTQAQSVGLSLVSDTTRINISQLLFIGRSQSPATATFLQMG
jgi:protein STE50